MVNRGIQAESTAQVQEPPRGWRRLIALGPGIVWAASSVGVAEVVFATRAGAIFGMVLLWSPIVSLFMKYFITELMGRYTVASGENVVSAFSRIEVKIGTFKILPKGWILWLFWILFIFSIAGMGGIALAVGSALFALVPGISYVVWSIIALLVVGIILFIGSYKALEGASRILIAVMVIFVIYAIVETAPPFKSVLAGLVPSVPPESLRELIPLLGWAGAGAIGTVWFSLWTQASGRGMAGKSFIPGPADRGRIKEWIKINRTDLIINTVIAGILTGGFLIAGALILYPLHLVPEGEGMGSALAKIAGQDFGRTGEVIFLLGVLGTLFGTLLADIDGLCRVATGALGLRKGKGEINRKPYRIFLLIYLVFAGVFALLIQAPVFMLQITAGVDTILLPVIAVLGIYVCTKFLPKEFRPGRFAVIMTYIAAAFFIFFIILLVSAMASGVKFSM